jgi:Cu/Ag efflux pump CusA
MQRAYRCRWLWLVPAPACGWSIFSIDNLSLMALAVSVGFVVDDAVVMIANMNRNLEHGMRPYQAARGRSANRLHGTVNQPFTLTAVVKRPVVASCLCGAQMAWPKTSQH